MELIKATYTATRPDRDPEALAENIAREQSLETPPSLVPDSVAERFLGRVLATRQIDDNRWALEIGYPAELASGQLGQLLQLLYGNVSFYPRIRLTDLDLPDALLRQLHGPLGGIEGVRSITGVPRRPLLMTALKPRGSAPEHFADIAYRFASAGGDIVKDDQNLVESDAQDFTSRIRCVSQSIETAAEHTGKRCLYLPHVAGSGDHLHRQLEAVAHHGLHGVVLCPWIMGLETAATAAREHGLMWLAHPAMAGSLTGPGDHGVSSEVLLGALVRVAGADISIFPGSSGRITSGHDDEQAICARLTEGLGRLRPSLPCIGGGKTLEQIPGSLARLGLDHAILSGGDLLGRGDRMAADLAATIEHLEHLERLERLSRE